jgi:oxygen-independent coproporphyrinogen-3 oxidase
MIDTAPSSRDDLPQPGTALYVHVPFCAAKCPYCDFYSFAAEKQDADGFVDVLLREAEARSARRPETVFLGGGTPSWLAASDLKRLLDGLDACTDFRASAREVTVECNPESLTVDKASLLVELGATRLSIGVQSLRPALLELFGRVHTVGEAFFAIDAARTAAAERVSVDLMYAAPGQDLDEWLDDLARILDLGLDHVSAYNLTFEEGTAFDRWRSEGRIAPQAEERELAFFWETRRAFKDASYRAYETSNFCTDGRRCEHNLNYWRNGPYVGLGPSAVSKVGHRRFGNPRSLQRWRASVLAGITPGHEGEWEETLPARARLGETWWLALRTDEGVDPVTARETAGFDETRDDDCEREARSLVDAGLLVLDASRFRLSARGLPLADAVAARFLDSSMDSASSDHRSLATT